MTAFIANVGAILPALGWLVAFWGPLIVAAIVFGGDRVVEA
jgi:hypothetical protein